MQTKQEVLDELMDKVSCCIRPDIPEAKNLVKMALETACQLGEREGLREALGEVNRA